jgi:hypothetical protein
MDDKIIILENKKTSKKPIMLMCSTLLIFILLGTTGYFYYQYQKLTKNPVTTQAVAQKEVQGLIKAIGRLMLLPKDETPTVATITDIDKLKDQLFFKNAKNGDKVLIYTNSKIAIIYDPKSNLIINVGPINFSQTQAQPSEQPQQKVRVGLRNGTSVTGLTYKMETEIKNSFPNASVNLKEQDKRTDYEKTTIIALNDASKDSVTDMAIKMNIQVGNLPSDETKPADLDILIIIGKDKS